jgi:hypothetical protein
MNLHSNPSFVVSMIGRSLRNMVRFPILPIFCLNIMLLDDESRKVAFNHLYIGLLDFFKVIHL